MKYLVYLISSITIYTLPEIRSQDTLPVPGLLGCQHNGYLDGCNPPIVPVSSLPNECTSFLYHLIISTIDFTIDDPLFGTGNNTFIHHAINSGKPAILYYGHLSGEDWLKVIASNTMDGGVNAKKELNNLKNYLVQYKTDFGFVLENLDILPASTIINYTGNVEVFIAQMRSTFPKSGIGITLDGKSLSDAVGVSNLSEKLDFNFLDSELDFYIIRVSDLNTCTTDLSGGISPVREKAPKTLYSVVVDANKLGIPSEKIYLSYRPGPRSKNEDDNPCLETNTMVCELTDLYGLCVDKTNSYCEKGYFVKEMGLAGFIMIDLALYDDPDGSCKCKPYPAFYNILACATDRPSIPCPLLDKP